MSSGRYVGRTFLHPAFDYLLIGGGLSLLFTAAIAVGPDWVEHPGPRIMAVVLLLANSAHFAASTVRLYARPAASQEMPFLTLALPILALLLLTVCLLEGERLGPHLYALYLTWSPYHYAAQAYGLAAMYSARSGSPLPPREKRLLRWTCMLPFVYALFAPAGAGLGWILPESVLTLPWVEAAWNAALLGLRPTIFVAPLLLYAWVWRAAGRPMPLISALIVITNGVWWALLSYRGFLWATVFHGIQYLAIVIIFHVKDRMAEPGNRHGVRYHVLWFYGVSLLLAYGLFHVLPGAYRLAGFGAVESLLLVIAVINIHHFVVDAFIWRFSKSGSNRRVVEGLTPARA